MTKPIELWKALPKTVKVFFYLAVSLILSEALVELGNVEQVFLVRISAQLINLILVFLEESAGEVKKRLSK